MKKLFLFLSLFSITLGTVTQAHANNSLETSGDKFYFGVKAGINYSDVWDEKLKDFNANGKIGLVGGVFFGIPVVKFIGIQPEVLISKKGFKGSGILLNEPYSFSRATTYLDIPMQLAVKPFNALSIVFGPQISFLLDEKNDYTFGINGVEQQVEFSKVNPRKYILGFVAGPDLNFNHVVLSGRVGWDLQTNYKDGSAIIPRYKNQWLQVTLGFKI